MKDGEKNPSYLGSQEWQYFCTGSLGEELVCLAVVKIVKGVSAATTVFCKAWSNSCWNQGIVQSPVGDVVGALWSLIFKEAVYFHATILYPKFNTEWGK